MPKKSPVPQIAPPSRLRLPVIGLFMAFAVLASYLLLHYSHAASGVMSLQTNLSPAPYGGNVVVSIYANGGSDALNAIQADLTYPTSKLQYVSYDNTGSYYPVDAVSPSGTPSTGTLQFVRSISGGTTPVSGNALVVKVTFKTIGLGSATVGLANTSLGLSAANSTNSIVGYNGVTFNVADTNAPSAPTGLTTTATTVNSVSLAWTAATDNVGVTGYDVFRGSTQVGTTPSVAYTDTGLAPNTSSTYHVVAVDAAGNTSASSNNLVAASQPDTTAPSVPAGLTATNRTLTGISLSWSAATDNVGVTGYRVYRNGSVIANPGNLTSYSDASLTPGTNYNYTVAAYDAAGNVSAQSSTLATSTLPDTTAPSTPGGLTLGTQSGGNIALTWSASTDNVGVTGYKIYRSGTQIATSTTPSGSYPTGSTPGTYSFTVAAVDAAGNTSPQSASVSVQVYGPSDINHDGKVNVIDLSLLLSNWGKSGNGDVNGDGTVNVIDLSLLLSTWTG